jgi:hypothetical protein
VQVTRSGYVRNRRTGTYGQQITLTNTSGIALPGPLFVVLGNLSDNATLASASGATSVFAPLERPYVLVPDSAGGFAPGASSSVILQFDNPTDAAITYGTHVVNGNAVP